MFYNSIINISLILVKSDDAAFNIRIGVII